MTVLAAMHDAERRVTWIGSDTFATLGPVKFACSPKWVVGSWWAIGCAGDGRLQTVVASDLADELHKGNSPADLAEKIREAVKEDGWNTNSEPGAPDYGVWIMLANPESVWTVCSAFSVDHMKGYWADGSGGQIAMGAMFTAKRRAMTPKDIVFEGIQAAIEHERQCGGKPWVHCLEYEVELAAVGD